MLVVVALSSQDFHRLSPQSTIAPVEKSNTRPSVLFWHLRALAWADCLQLLFVWSRHSRQSMVCSGPATTATIDSSHILGLMYDKLK